jgi:capsular exopolysaccharide synthesis family protein
VTQPLHPQSLVSLDLEPDERKKTGAVANPVGSRPEELSRSSAAELEDHLITLLSPQSFEADQYRVLRQYLADVRAARSLRVLAVTSPAAGDGKTTTAINLAVTLAQTPGSRVLLVDTDLRRPSVAANLGLDTTEPGLAQAATDERLDLSKVVRSTPYELDVLPAGVPPPNPYQVLESARVGHLLDEARSSYDCVVLDTPPVLLVPDCKLMSQWVDGFLLVAAAHRTPRKLLGEALNAMDEAKVLGIVFNGDERPLSGYYGRYYGNYYHESHASNGRHGQGWWSSLRRKRASESGRRWR